MGSSAGGSLIERAGQLDLIEGALAAASARRGGVALLEGPAGIGKTALLEAAADRAGDLGLVVFSACGAELEAEFPYGVVRQLLESTVRAAPRARQRRLLAGAAALAGPAVLPQAMPAVPGEQAFAVLHGLYWLVANLAGEAPMVLLVDDAHWADAPSLRFLAYLARRLSGLAATVIVSVRTGESGSDRRLIGELENTPGARVAVPKPLSEAGVAALLASDFGRAPDSGFVRSCRYATGGNPFYVRELAAALIADRIEPTADATERLSAAVPRRIALVTLSRLGRLSDDAALLARAIAVLGRDARLPIAGSMAGLAETRALAALDALVAADVVSAGRALDFRHPIVRAAVYDELAPGARSTAHLRAASLLNAEGAELDVVAGHLLLTDPIGAPDTIATLRDAASHALTLGAPESAATYLSRALEEGPGRELRTEMLLELALAEKLARQPAAIEHLLEVRRLAEDPATRGRAMIEHAEILWFVGDWAHALSLLDGALAELPDPHGPLALRAEGMRATLTAYDPRLVETFVERLPRLQELAAAGRVGARPLTLVLAGWSASRDEPRDLIDSLVELGWDDGRYVTDGETPEVLPQAIVALVLGDELDRAAELVAAIRAAAQDTGSVMLYLVASGHDALIEGQRGNLANASAELRSCLERSLELGLQLPATAMVSYCTDVLLERPDVADLAELAETMDLGPLSEVFGGAMVFEARGRLRFAAGRREDALTDMRRAGAISEALGFTNPGGMPCWRSWLALMLAATDREEAFTLTQAELVDARRSGLPRRIGIALRALGLVDPDEDAGVGHLEEALAVLADSPARLEHARALVELGAMRRRRGNRAGARAPLREGLELATRCGAVRLAERARTELAATGARARRDYTTGRDALTPSEHRVAQMAADGHTTKQIAQALFVTTGTIETHLHRTYAKLGITSRKQLGEALAQPNE